MTDNDKKALAVHLEKKGKIKIVSTFPLENKEDLSIAYTPGVAAPCREIAKDVSKVYDYTGKGNMVAIISDGTAVLGLGDIGPEAGLPVMEGKAVLFQEFGGVNAIPICIGTKNVDEIVKFVELLEPSFGGINLEDISAPRCFEIEERLKKSLNIPVFHDDQHGTAIVTLSALINAAQVVKKDIKTLRVVLSGAGAAGVAITKLFQYYGIKNIIVCDSQGIMYSGRDHMNEVKNMLVESANPNNMRGSLSDALKGADVFVGVSKGGLLSQDMVRSMANDAIVFAMANPDPEIMPQEALDAGAAVVGTGRSDFPNQINNVLVFPGIFRGVLDARTKEISEDMKIAAAVAIAGYVKNIAPDNVIPKALDRGVGAVVAEAVKKIATS
ncbi:NAD-dependent malic enzyme [Candidatus Peregrinibacteria bacterium]|nr:MAG: NAD-dependent malic enzyme [Candidatus Peregrinibacteria bacterium]